MSSENKVSRMALQKAFPGIPDDETNRLLSQGKIIDYPSDSVLCHEDQIENTFYILLDGEVKVTKVINDEEIRMLKILNSGDFFGEMGIIHNAPRAATVTTTRQSLVLEISRPTFEHALRESSTVSLAMVKEVSRRLRENDEMAIEDLRLKAGELAVAYQQLAELELARREFLTTIAHELRTPLMSASGFMQMIRMGMMEGEALNSGLDTVSRNLDQIITLTNDILFMQEMDLILSEFEEVNINELITRMVEAEKEFAREMGVTINVTISPSLPLVMGDIKSLERAFGAFINNAIKFSLEGTDVEITADHNPSYVWVSIRDYGMGIAPEDLENIFKRFWRTEEHEGQLFGGVGLGLPIARQVVEQHGGEIEVKSGIDEGSTFIMRLKISSSEVKGSSTKSVF